MREILFRGKRVDNGEWIEGLLIKTKTEFDNIYVWNYAIQYHCPTNGTSYRYETVEVAPETIGQFTGQTDRNDVKIFEGDIYKDKIYSGTPGVWNRFIGIIEYRFDAFKVAGINRYEGLHADLYQTGEVIGNIYDNQTFLNLEQNDRN